MNLYLVHCGFYDTDAGDGIYESHTNLFVAAESFEDARRRIKEKNLFREKRMHIDGIQEVLAIDGYELQLAENEGLRGESVVRNFRHRDLAPKRVEDAKLPVH